jgi:phosphinothricin acetyltransferase
VSSSAATDDRGELTVRAAAGADLAAIDAIYSHYVLQTHVTFDLVPFTPDQRREWFSHYGTTGRHRLLVATRDSEVVGYASSSSYRPKQAYETSVESSVYLAPDATGRGIGSLLYDELFRALEGEDIHRVYAGIAIPNPASIALHHRFGFSQVGYFSEQGRKLGRYWDVAWFEKPLGPDHPARSV